jgi:hypothetical protein
MKLKQQATLLIACITAQAFLAACTREDNPATTPGDELQINVTIAAHASIEPGSRATDAAYVTSFADDDQIGVIAVQGGAVVLDNIPYAYGSGAWTPATAGKAYIPPGTVDWLVYYPYSVTMNGKKTVQEILDAFTPTADQGDQAKYTSSDLMTWSGAISGNALTATLAHALALVEINLPAGASDATLDAGDGTVLPWNISGTTWRCLLKPAANATLDGAYTRVNGISTWQQANVTLEAGKYTTLNVTNGI